MPNNGKDQKAKSKTTLQLSLVRLDIDTDFRRLGTKDRVRYPSCQKGSFEMITYTNLDTILLRCKGCGILYGLVTEEKESDLS